MKKITALAALLAIPAMAAPAGYFQVPGTDTTLKIYGNIQLREAYGLNGDGMNTDMTARSGGNDDTQQKGQWSGSWRAYLGATTTTPSAFGDVVTKIYGRFKNADKGNGQAVTFNMEQAYIQIGGFKAGTDWPLMGEAAWEPNTLFGCVSDENGDWYAIRQLTYIAYPVKGLELGVSMEGQNSDSKGTSNGSVPNLSAVAAYSQDWGGVTFAMSYQQKKDWTKAGNDASGTGLSWILSGGWNITANDQLTAMILRGGNPYGSYNDGFVVDATDANNYYFYKSLAYNVCYTHTWNDQFSSAVTIGQVKWAKDDSVTPRVDPATYSVEAASDDYKLTEFIVNTTWQMTKTVSLGVEYQHTTMKAANTQPFVDSNGVAQDSNKLDQFRFKLKANLF